MLIKEKQQRTFVDLFAGCGGLSLGLVQAGWTGLFAVEKAKDAFATFASNFLAGPMEARFDWPGWLEKRPHSIGSVLETCEQSLRRLRGSVDVVAGGPPCQGFSYAGRRIKSDPRNMLFRKYVQFVKTVEPSVVVLENVPGMQVPHGTVKRRGRRVPGPVPSSFCAKLIDELDAIGYVAESRLLDAADYGVPQRRPRMVVIGLKRSVARGFVGGVGDVFEYVEAARVEQLLELGLEAHVTARDAISDLAIGKRPLLECDDPASWRGFNVPTYLGPTTTYQRLMHDDFHGNAMDSMRLANHTGPVLRRFKLILRKYRKGVQLGSAVRQRLGLLKRRTIPMAPGRLAPTITTLPDDILHYEEPRILTVRESARLQSFPDWFKFLGVYTTGGARRKKACPRYTQVGNAVPPLLSRAIGLGIARALNDATTEVKSSAIARTVHRPSVEVATLS